jgi:hypothetical protein
MYKVMIYKKQSLITGLFGLMIVLVAHAVAAQPADRMQPHRDQIEAIKTRFFTRQMQLTPEEARLFWPIYDTYMAKQEKLRMQRDERTPESIEVFAAMTDEEINVLIDARLQQAETALEERKKLITALREVLPPRKVAMFLRAEHRFTDELRKRLEERRELDTRRGWD